MNPNIAIKKIAFLLTNNYFMALTKFLSLLVFMIYELLFEFGLCWIIELLNIWAEALGDVGGFSLKNIATKTATMVPMTA